MSKAFLSRNVVSKSSDMIIKSGSNGYSNGYGGGDGGYGSYGGGMGGDKMSNLGDGLKPPNWGKKYLLWD